MRGKHTDTKRKKTSKILLPSLPNIKFASHLIFYLPAICQGAPRPPQGWGLQGHSVTGGRRSLADWALTGGARRPLGGGLATSARRAALGRRGGSRSFQWEGRQVAAGQCRRGGADTQVMAVSSARLRQDRPQAAACPLSRQGWESGCARGPPPAPLRQGL